MNIESTNSRNLSNVARTLRTARKLKGLGQVEAAKELGISQSYLSKLENGTFFPDTDIWYHCCDQYEIRSEDAFRYGYIDHCYYSSGRYPKSKLKIDARYTKNAASKVRTSLPFLQYFERIVGEKKLNRLLRKMGFDPDFFCVLDQELNLYFLLDLIAEMKSQGYLSPKHLRSIVQLLNRPQTHGRLFQEYESLDSQKDVLQKLIKNSKFYEANFSYMLDHKGGIRGSTLLIEPREHMVEFKLPRTEAGLFLCEYKKAYFQFFANFGTVNGLGKIHETECYFKGSGRCIYEIRL